MSQQIVIPVSGLNELTFNSYCSKQNNALVSQLIRTVHNPQTNPVMFIWGQSGSGKTHLLNACCDLAKSNNQPFTYVSADNLDAQRLSASDVAAETVFCIDNLERIGGNRETAVVLMSWYEQTVSGKGCMIAAAAKPLEQIELGTADLKSRLSVGGSYYVEPLDESDTRLALKQRAHQRGFDLGDSVLDYIMNHFERDTTSLFAMLDRIDSASLTHQRKVTIPFIRELLS